MDTKKFRTRQEHISRINPKGKDYVIGIDVGYSAVKVFYELGNFVFPSYCIKVDSDNILLSNEKDILYKDEETGDVYMVGYTAQDMSVDRNDTEIDLFTRKRYSDIRFRILCNTGLAIALFAKKDTRPITVQTGLPASYLAADTPAIKKVLSHSGPFQIKVGTGAWQRFDLTIDNVYVMPQPSGALYSVLIKNDGQYIEDAKKILSSNVCVLDIGFGTFDFFGIKNRSISVVESVDTFGMKTVMQETAKKILEEYGEDIRISALQQSLTTGYVDVIDEDAMKAEAMPFGEFLREANERVMKAALEKAKSVTSSFRDYKYIIIDGGTGEAWYEGIKEYLSGMKTLTIMPSNYNDHQSFIYSNARGYYMYRVSQQNKKAV